MQNQYKTYRTYVKPTPTPVVSCFWSESSHMTSDTVQASYGYSESEYEVKDGQTLHPEGQ